MVKNIRIIIGLIFLYVAIIGVITGRELTEDNFIFPTKHYSPSVVKWCSYDPIAALDLGYKAKPKGDAMCDETNPGRR